MRNTKKISEVIKANGIDVKTILSSDSNDYLSLTDLAKFKNPDTPKDVIKNWLRIHDTINFIGLWEELHNGNFNKTEYGKIRDEAWENSFVMSPQQWIERTATIGIMSRSGRYGGTYAHSDIAFEFASWLSPEFKLYVIKDYQRLKQAESDHLSLDWSARRELAKTNYRIHTDAIKENLITDTLPATLIQRTYANEADVINIALFGMTAKEWRDAHPTSKGNLRDEANIMQLIVLSNLENLNANFIKEGLPQSERLTRLHAIAVTQLKAVSSSPSAKRLVARFTNNEHS